MSDGRLAGKAAVITGAASGIGRASALRFAAAGARLLLVDTQGAAGEELVREIERSGEPPASCAATWAGAPTASA